MRVWEYAIDPSTRTWVLYATDAERKVAVLEARYDHTAKPSIAEYAQFIVDACNEAEWEAENPERTAGHHAPDTE